MTCAHTRPSWCVAEGLTRRVTSSVTLLWTLETNGRQVLALLFNDLFSSHQLTHLLFAGEIAVSEEAWWLRRACSRGRCRLLKELSDAFGLKVASVKDIHCRDLQHIVVPSVDTIVHDMTISGSVSDGIVSVFNECMDTTRPFNGILSQMHPGEGYWLFRGAKAVTPFGSTFGDSRRCGAFPVIQPRLDRGYGISVSCEDPCVIYHGENKKFPQTYQCFDEAFHKKLEQMDWNRDNGYVELIPIIVAASV